MRREFIILAFIGAALFFYTRAQGAFLPDPASADPVDDVTPPPSPDPLTLYIPGTVNDTSINPPPPGLTADQYVAAGLALIRQFETRNDYSALYGGGHFSDFTEHPNIPVPIHLPGYEGKHSTAAGAYQFLYGTWEPIKERLGLPDFSPASQDAAAVELLKEIGALGPLQSGDFDTFLRLASSQWASLPYSAAKQHPQSIVAANDFLAKYLASVA